MPISVIYNTPYPTPLKEEDLKLGDVFRFRSGGVFMVCQEGWGTPFKAVRLTVPHDIFSLAPLLRDAAGLAEHLSNATLLTHGLPVESDVEREQR